MMTIAATVVGVVADFHFGSLHRPIEPLLIAMPENAVNGSDSPAYAVLRLAPGDPQEGIEFIRQTSAITQRSLPFRLPLCRGAPRRPV